MTGWIKWTGGPAPDTAGRKIYVRLRSSTRDYVLRHQEPQIPSYWKRWTHDGGAGDIIEYMEEK